MGTNLVELAGNYLTPEVIQKASALVGGSPEATRRALSTATPAIVAGLAGEASTPSGADRLKRVLDEESAAGGDAKPSLAELLRSGSGEDLVQRGTGLLSRIFGSRMSSIVEATADASGTPTSSMASLLGLAAPIVFGVLGHQARARHLDAAGLASLLAEQKSAIPANIAAAVVGRAPARPEEPARTAPRAPEHASSRLWPLLLLVPLLVAGGLLLRRREAPPAENWTPRSGLGAGVPEIPPPPDLRAAPEVPLPPAPPPAVAPPLSPIAVPGVAAELSRFLASAGGEPSRRFVFEDLTFDFAEPTLTPGALPTLDAVAAALRASPGAQVLVEGHTDATGVPADNERLSLERAGAVKDALVARGVDADRITVAGLGQDRPVAPNDTAEGRARNRRTEIVVTRR